MTARTYRALLVANSVFPDDPQNLPELEGPRNDAALLRDALCDREYGLFATDNVRLVQERTMGDVLRELEDFLRSASRQDTVLLYYSGHGVLDQSNEFFFCAQNSRTDRLRSTAIKASDVSQMIEESAAATTLILLDCCHSGRFKGGDLPGKLAGQGRFVITSSRGGELARDAHAQNHASLFTHHLVEGLMGRAPDRDRDGVVCLGDLYDYVHDSLRDSGRQIPQKRFEGSGDVPIAMRPGADTESAAPELLDPAVSAPVLDVSETEIDLGLVPGDEQLPPERIVVINRGGGTLRWTVRSSADWVEAVADETGVDLHLRPEPGPNRANVYIADEATGRLKTVRIRVRVEQAPAPVDGPGVADEAAADHGLDPGQSGAPDPLAGIGRRSDSARPTAVANGALSLRLPASWLPKATLVLAVVAAAWFLVTALSLLDERADEGASDLFLRSHDGVGLAESMILALGGGLAALVALFRRRHDRLGLAALATVFLALALWRLTERSQFKGTAEWYSSWSGFGAAVAFCLLVAAMAAAATVTGGEALRPPTAPSGPGLATIALASVWAVSLAQDIYVSADEGLIGDHTEERWAGRGWQLTAIVVLLLLTLAAVTVLTEVVARGVLVGVTSVALAISAAEVLYAASEWEAGVLTAWRLPILLVPALALAWWTRRGLRTQPRLRHDPPSVTTAPVSGS